MTWPEFFQKELLMVEDEIVLKISAPVHDLSEAMTYKTTFLPHRYMNKISKAELNHIFCVTTA